MKIDHIGIAVKNLETSVSLFESLLNSPCYKRELVESEQVETAFFQTGESKVELLGASGPDSVISKYIEKRGEGIHHIAFEVNDIEYEMKRLQKDGYRFLSESPKAGADNKRIVFLHPKDTNSVLVELCQSTKS